MTRASWLRAIALGVALLALEAGLAHACPSCIDTRSGRARWFSYTTILLTLMPLALIGGVVLWLRSAAKRAE